MDTSTSWSEADKGCACRPSVCQSNPFVIDSLLRCDQTQSFSFTDDHVTAPSLRKKSEIRALVNSAVNYAYSKVGTNVA